VPAAPVRWPRTSAGDGRATRSGAEGSPVGGNGRASRDDPRYHPGREADVPSEARFRDPHCARERRLARDRRQDQGVARARRALRDRRRWPAPVARHTRARLVAGGCSSDPLVLSPRLGIPAARGGGARHTPDGAAARQGGVARDGADRSRTAGDRASRGDSQPHRRRGGSVRAHRSRRGLTRPARCARGAKRRSAGAPPFPLPRRGLAPAHEPPPGQHVLGLSPWPR